MSTSIIPTSFSQTVSEKIDWYLSLPRDGGYLETVIKVITYATIIIPLIAFAIKECMDLIQWLIGEKGVQISAQIPHEILARAPKFQNYSLAKGTKYETNLSNVAIRPINLFLDKFAPGSVTLPSLKDPQPLSISLEYAEIRRFIFEEEPFTVSIEAGKEKCGVLGFDDEVDLEKIYGAETFSISQKELQSLLISFKIHMSPDLGNISIKEQDYYLFVNSDGTIRDRKPGEKDAICMIDICNVRGPHTNGSDSLKAMFAKTLGVAEKGYLILPLLGIDETTTDLRLYWEAFFAAICETRSELESIFFSPAIAGAAGRISYEEEFKALLKHQQKTFPNNYNLKKIVPLDPEVDILHLSLKIKKDNPEKKVSLVNDCYPFDPSGDSVGGQINQIGHTFTSEEAYSTLGTKGFMFPQIIEPKSTSADQSILGLNDAS